MASIKLLLDHIDSVQYILSMYLFFLYLQIILQFISHSCWRKLRSSPAECCGSQSFIETSTRSTLTMQGVCFYRGNNTKLLKKQSPLFLSEPPWLPFFCRTKKVKLWRTSWLLFSIKWKWKFEKTKKHHKRRLKIIW